MRNRKIKATAVPAAKPNPAARAKLELTSDECNALLQMVDVFIKTTGLNGAQPGLVLAARVQQAAVAAFGPPPETPVAPAA